MSRCQLNQGFPFEMFNMSEAYKFLEYIEYLSFIC